MVSLQYGVMVFRFHFWTLPDVSPMFFCFFQGPRFHSFSGGAIKQNHHISTRRSKDFDLKSWSILFCWLGYSPWPRSTSLGWSTSLMQPGMIDTIDTPRAHPRVGVRAPRGRKRCRVQVLPSSVMLGSCMMAMLPPHHQVYESIETAFGKW